MVSKYSNEHSFKCNEQHINWKGDNVKMRGLHRWVERRKPKPKLCEECGKREPRELTNISGLYKRDINDFKWKCRYCHRKEHYNEKNVFRVNGKYASHIQSERNCVNLSGWVK